MASIEEMLAQAESMTVEENWFRLEKYPEKSFYSDSDIGVDVVDRKISNADRNVSTTEEKNSQYISFIMDRYCDGVDLTTMLIQVKYELPDGSGSIDGVVNAYASESQIRFGWVVPSTITQEEGTILLMVFCSGNLSDGNPYLLKTQPLPYTINKTLDIEGTLPEPDENWYLQFTNTMNERVTAAASYSAQAREAANEADETLAAVEDIQSDVNTSKKEIQTLASQVQSNTSKAQNAATNAEASASSASKSAENAKKYSELAFATTPEGYEVWVKDVDLLKNSIVQTTDRTLYGSKEGGIKLIGIKGASEQKQYSGKNLANSSGFPSTTKLGITNNHVYNSNGCLEYVSFDGTAEDVYGMGICQADLKAGETYILNGCPSGGSTSTYRLQLRVWNGDNGNYLDCIDTGSGATYSPESNVTVRVFARISTGAIVSNLKFYPMISVEGGDYEPYVGATQSPNPIYPQEIESVGDLKNLLEVTATSQTVNGIAHTVNVDKSITLVGTNTLSSVHSLSISPVFVLKKGAYLLSGCTNGSGTTYRLNLYKNDDQTTPLRQNLSGENEFILDEDTELVVKIAVTAGVAVNTTIYPMIRKASVSNAVYKLHGYSLGIKADNNIYDKSQNTNGKYVDSNGIFVSNDGWSVTEFILLTKGTYTISGITTLGSAPKHCLFTLNKAFIRVLDIASTDDYTFTVEEDVYLVSSIYNLTGNDIDTFKVACGTKYRSKSITIPLNEPLRGIGEVKDEVVCQDGVWGVLRRIGADDFDGSSDETILFHNESTQYYKVYCENAKGSGNAQKSNALLCDRLIVDCNENLYNAYVSNAITLISDDYVSLRFDETITSIALFREKLANYPIHVEYELATPTFEPFTDQTPFYGLESFDTVTYISTDSEVEPSIELKFAKTEGDAVTLLNYNQTNLNRIAIEEFIKASTSQEEVTE